MKQKYVFRISEFAVGEGASIELVGCPFIVMPTGYPDRINEYLQDMWTGNWHAAFAAPGATSPAPEFAPRTRYRPLPSSIRETANRLVNFLHWCGDQRMHQGKGRLDPLAVVEKDVDRFGDQMEAGLWSSDRKALSLSTIGQRQLAVIQFLQWAKARGYVREAQFTFSTVARKVGAPSGGVRTTLRRQFLVVRRSQPGTIRFPTEAEVKSAVASVADVALQIGVRLVFFCGLRAEEVCGLSLSDVTNDKMSAGGQRFIRVLGKGRKRRSVEIDADLLDDILGYMDCERPIRLRRHRAKSDKLLINDNTGRQFLYRTFWEAFRENGCHVPPHIGRHWYAVMYLLRAWRREEAKARRKGLHISTDMMRSLLSIDLIRLQQNLGHAHLSTTERYLVALDQFIDKADLAMSFQDMIDGGQPFGGLDD